MNLVEAKYSGFELVKEMMATVDVIKRFDQNRSKNVADKISSVGKLLLAGEGSSRIFPAKNAIRKSKLWGTDIEIITEGSRQASYYNLSDSVVFLASNSGKTNEVIALAEKVISNGNDNCFALTAFADTMLEQICRETYVLNCGSENAVAASKSVVEQALFYESILWNIIGVDKQPDMIDLSEKIQTAMTVNIDKNIIDATLDSSIIYFAGYNDGVAEELTLKTNEIARKKSDYLEGTYAVHGIEEVLEKGDVIFIIDPIKEETEKFQKVLVDGAGAKVFAIATHETPFQTIITPDAGDFNPYLFLCTGWNLLVEIGLASGQNLDKTNRARKVGNEYTSII